jgi:hypothetical protein
MKAFKSFFTSKLQKSFEFSQKSFEAFVTTFLTQSFEITSAKYLSKAKKK